jgi:hypothetical protein
MKKLGLLFTFLFVTTFTNAQFTVTDYDGVQILDGDIRGFNSTVASDATLYFWINNLSPDDDIFIKIKLESITNSDGSSFQFCFGTLCIFDVDEGQTYPTSGIPETIPAGGTNPQFDKFQNENEGNGSDYPIDYVWKFFQVDGDGNEIGESMTFTYRFDPNLSALDFDNNLGVTLQSTIVNDFIEVKSVNQVNFEIFSLNGALINKGQVGSGINKISIPNYNKGLYFIRFSDNNNTSTFKFVVK